METIAGRLEYEKREQGPITGCALYTFYPFSANLGQCPAYIHRPALGIGRVRRILGCWISSKFSVEIKDDRERDRKNPTVKFRAGVALDISRV